MTMLEKMALRIAAVWQDCPVDMETFSWDDVNGWTKEMAFDCARAALMAIREPDREVVNKGVAAGHKASGLDDVLHLPSAFTAMIDAILNEPT